MNDSALGLATVASTLPTQVLLLLLSSGLIVLVLLVCVGIALPAVWSAKPARRKAAAAVLRQILDTCIGAHRR